MLSDKLKCLFEQRQLLDSNFYTKPLNKQTSTLVLFFQIIIKKSFYKKEEEEEETFWSPFGAEQRRRRRNVLNLHLLFFQ